MTYLAEQVMAKRRVCIKEFFPKDYYTRGDDTRSLMLASQGFAVSMNRYKEKFVKEAQTIAALDHHNIIPIYDVFEENNTAYYVMEYIDGESLSDVIKRRGALAEGDAVEYIRQAAEALGYLHERRIMHLDIKPGNIMVRRKDNRVVLIDFGLSKHYDEQSGEATSTTPVGVSHGYAPMEQYKQGGVNTFSPETDIYSLGATLYALVVGHAPQEAATLITEPLDFPGHISLSLRSAITAAMAISPKERPASVGEFLAMLNGVGTEGDTIPEPKPMPNPKPTPNPIPKPNPKPTPNPKPAASKPKSRKWWLWLIVLFALVAIVGGVIGVVGDNDSQPAAVGTVVEEITVEDLTVFEDDSQPAAVGTVGEEITVEDLAVFKDDSQLVESENDTTLKSNDGPAPVSELKLMSESKLNFDHNKGQGTISYSLTNTDDVPNVISNKSWITINSVSKSGIIAFSVSANGDKESRDATIKVEYRGQYFSISVTQSGKRYKVGDYYNENGKKGVVFEVWDGGQHGKIVSMDVTTAVWDTRIEWSPEEQYYTGTRTYADSEYDGKANTDKIMARSDRDYFPAFTWCRAKGDSWYLPAKSELETIYRSKETINATLSKHGVPIWGSDCYWLSTEKDEFCAWGISMYDGDTNFMSKDVNYYVRAVSAF